MNSNFQEFVWNINNHGSFPHYLTHNEMISRLGCTILCKSLYQFCHPKPRVVVLVHGNVGKATRDEISELFYSRIVIKYFQTNTMMKFKTAEKLCE